MLKPTFTIVACSVFLTVMTSGCDQFMQKPHCPALDSCGGDLPKGTYILDSSHPSCSEDIYVPPADPRVNGGMVPVQRQPPLDPALSDWCDSLVTNGGTMLSVHDPDFYYDDPHIGVASVTFKPDLTFSAGLTQIGHYTLDFPAYCMRAFAAMDNSRPADPVNNPDGGPARLCDQLTTVVHAAGTGEGAYQNAACTDSKIESGGCQCTFDVTATSGPAGIFSQEPGSPTLQILLNNNYPQQVTYCNRGDHIELTGANGSYLFGKTGLRTMSLAKQPDTMQSPTTMQQ
ncbi:MAG TPA: hypothetical protein VH374_09855 [Polyangia bacterium]|jgi:hypothetical protein|nr:hypothetical protein [Polyangia bacterium]